MTHPGPAVESTPRTHTLLNSGLVVLTPNHEIANKISSLLTSTDAEDQEKIASWMFPDQDLLADVFRGKWVSLPWTYNAIKTMRYWHGNFYRDEEVRNLHYICDKPWQRRPARNSDEEARRSSQVYKVDAGDFEGIKDMELGLPSEQADAITHGWWWEEYEVMVNGMKTDKYSHLDYLEGLVAK
jgi:inositol 3-alpha-galactosyltransferase